MRLFTENWIPLRFQTKKDRSVWTRALDMFVRSFHFCCCLAKVECFKRFCHFEITVTVPFFVFLAASGASRLRKRESRRQHRQICWSSQSRKSKIWNREKFIFEGTKKYMYMYMLIHVLQEFKETLGPFIPGKVKRVCYIRLVPNKMQIVPFIPACLT